MTHISFHGHLCTIEFYLTKSTHAWSASVGLATNAQKPHAVSNMSFDRRKPSTDYLALRLCSGSLAVSPSIRNERSRSLLTPHAKWLHKDLSGKVGQQETLSGTSLLSSVAFILQEPLIQYRQLDAASLCVICFFPVSSRCNHSRTNWI